MRIASITDTEALSGAGIAALRLHRALLAAGMDCVMAVARKNSNAEEVEPLLGPVARAAHSGRRLAMRSVLRALGARDGETLSANLIPTGVHRRVNALDADVVHLHWVGMEMVRIEEIARIRGPVVWTMHDEWFALGLQHYADLATEGPVVASGRPTAWRALDRSVRRRKADAWRSFAPEIVCPSRWLAGRIVESALAPQECVHVIANTLPQHVFKPLDRETARRRLGLPLDRSVIGMGALRALDDPRKGYRHLTDALGHVAAREGSRAMVLVFGADSGPELPLEARFAGTVTSDAALAQLYAAMDVFVCPSRQENLPNTIAEALSCGVPCVAFNVGGIPDLIDHGVSGYLARPYDAADLANGMIDCLCPVRRRVMSEAARAVAVQRLAGTSVAARHAEIYCQALERAGRLNAR